MLIKSYVRLKLYAGFIVTIVVNGSLFLVGMENWLETFSTVLRLYIYIFQCERLL